MMKGRLLVCAATALALVGMMQAVAMGDVTVKRQSNMDGMGGLLKSSTKSTESYSGDMMTNDSEVKMENKLFKMFGGGKPIHTTQITRLDKELMWNVDHKDKSYTEMTFAETRAMMDSLGAMLGGGADPMAQQEPAIDTSEITFSEPRFDITKTGKTETISGYNCEQVIMTMVTVGTNRKTGDTMTLDLKMDMMLAQNVPGSEEITQFGIRMATAMGFEMDKGAGQSMAKMLAMYGIDGERLAEEAKKLEGFAMKTVMTFSMGGDAMEKAQAEADDAKKEQEEKDTEEEAKKDEEAPTDASGMAAKALGGLFGKKEKKEDKDKADAAPDAPAGAMMWMTSLVTGIETGAVPPETFEVPNEYKLKKTALQE